jgi:phosphohistidine phosphatase
MASGDETRPQPPLHRLVLLRHAKAEPAGSVPDPLRPLALTGRKQAVAVGSALSTAGIAPDVVLCSSALRTRQTWELVASRLTGSPHVEVRDELYEVTVRELLAAVRELDETAGTVLVVGHEPTMAATSGFLAGDGSDAGAVAHAHVGLSTSAYGILEGDVPWSAWDRACARLVYLGRPDKR